jgi:hypothetical protein
MPGQGLALLSLDGGGVRGLSSLQILKVVMQRIADAQKLDDVPKPCDFFDMIGGTSTGGYVPQEDGIFETDRLKAHRNHARPARNVRRRMHRSLHQAFKQSVQSKASSCYHCQWEDTGKI